MKISMRGIAVFLGLLGLLDLTIGHKVAGAWIYGVILLVAGVVAWARDGRKK